jgi:hypothetical protein
MLPWFVRDYIVATRQVPLAERGAYTDFLFLSWEMGPLPKEPGRLAHPLRLPPDPFAIPSVSSDSAKKPKNRNDDQDDAEDTDAAVTITVPISAEATAEAAEQENDNEYYEDEP